MYIISHDITKSFYLKLKRAHFPQNSKNPHTYYILDVPNQISYNF